MIHEKNQTPFQIPNTTHWIHCANEYNACPIFPGDTRITMINVAPLDVTELVPKKELITQLKKESQDFITEIMYLELPDSNDRLNVPVITTEDKKMTAAMNQSSLDAFIEEKCFYAPGETLKFSDFVEVFLTQLHPMEVERWSKIRIGRELPSKFPKGRSKSNNQVYIGNMSLVPVDSTAPPLRLEGEHLV